MRVRNKLNPQVFDAMQATRRILQPTERELAQIRLNRAKRLMTAASAAILSGDELAAAAGDAALREFEAAEAEITKLDMEDQ